MQMFLGITNANSYQFWAKEILKESKLIINIFYVYSFAMLLELKLLCHSSKTWNTLDKLYSVFFGDTNGNFWS